MKQIPFTFEEIVFTPLYIRKDNDKQKLKNN